MVADQSKKRLRADSNIDSSLDPHGLKKKKKKKQGLTRYKLKLKSNVSLIWDDKKRRVLAKKEQIGISHRDLAPFLDSLSHHQNILADVFTLPHETFELKNLSEVLSHKVTVYLVVCAKYLLLDGIVILVSYTMEIVSGLAGKLVRR